jgi:prolyl-tRNA synthetase
VPTIESLVALSNERYPRADRPWQGGDTLKNVVVKVRELDGTSYPLVIGLPGDREVDEKRLETALAPAGFEPFTEEDFAAHPELVRGYLGPVRGAAKVLGENGSAKVRYLTDPRVVSGTRWITGANETDRHVYDLVAGRDFVSDGVIDVAEVRSGDPAPDGSGPLRLARGIEIGHIFQLGRKYAEALGLQVLDQNGKLVTVTMGSYGLGVSRAVAAIAESTADDKGLAWPREVAPYDVLVLATGKDQAVFSAARDLAAQLDAAGIDVLLDDRKASPGVKFTDSEVLGIPTIVVIGRAFATGNVEIRDRATGASREVAFNTAASEVLREIKG